MSHLEPNMSVQQPKFELRDEDALSLDLIEA